MRRSEFIFKYQVQSWPEYNMALIERTSMNRM